MSFQAIPLLMLPSLSFLSSPLRFSPAAVVWLALLSQVCSASDLPSTSAIPPGKVRGRIVSTDGCHLDLQPELKDFLLAPNEAASYHDLLVELLPGERPVLTIFYFTDYATSLNEGKEETIQLWHVRTKEEFHSILQSNGFIRTLPVDESNLAGESHQSGSNDYSAVETLTHSGLNIVPPYKAAKKAFLDAQSRGEDMLSMSFAAMDAFLEARTSMEIASKDQSRTRILANGREIIHGQILEHDNRSMEQDHNKKKSRNTRDEL